MATPALADRRPSADWGRAADGIQLAGFAVFLLLNTTGQLPWSFWIDAIALWPVLIMSAGLRMAVDRTRAPWLQLLSPLLVLGSLAWVAAAQQPFVAVRDWKPVSIARPAGAERSRLEGQLLGTRVAATLGPVAPGTLSEGRMASRRGTGRIEASVAEGSAVVRVEGPRRGGPFLGMPGSADYWELSLDETLPLTVHLGGAMSRVVLDLGAGRLEKGSVEGVFLGTDLRLPRPEKDTAFRIRGVFNAVTISVPEGTPVRVHGPGLPLNFVDRGVSGAGPGYDVTVEGVFSAASVQTRPLDQTRRHEPPPAAPARHSPDDGARARPPAEAPPAR
jgi:hypothetical protein